MHVEICKWYEGAYSPVLFMIDDLANTWVDSNDNGLLDWGEDWGYFKNEANSSFRFLTENFLEHFPAVKVTFFVPVGVRAGILETPLFPIKSLPMNSDAESKRFFRFIHQHPNFELAYHGTTHGKAGRYAQDFVQEWSMFQSTEEAICRVQEGIEIFQDSAGARPRGGKYCGYTSNEYSDESIDQTGFSWWCRYWNRGMLESGAEDICGQDSNPLTNFDVKRFGTRHVIDIPSTLNGALLNGAYRKDRSVKGVLKRVLRKAFIRWKLHQIDELLKHRLVISIQEHIAPSRDDGKRQSPNIFDDCKSLYGIFRYLADKKVWYCTGSELADYVNLRDHVTLVMKDTNRFELEHETPYRNQVISLALRDHDQGSYSIKLPNQGHVDASGGIVNLPVMKGEYFIIKGGG